jgi:polyhydroxyalkanoate synthesis regulator phasin
MEDLFKKILYAGVGIVSLTAEKLQGIVSELVKDEKLSIEEGKKIVTDFEKDIEGKRDEFETQLKTITEKTIKSFRFVSKDELVSLKTRIENLEAKQEATKTTKSTKTTKKLPAETKA